MVLSCAMSNDVLDRDILGRRVHGHGILWLEKRGPSRDHLGANDPREEADAMKGIAP